MKAGIINIGDELLIGQVVNTNASWMGAKLIEWGWDVVEIRNIPDLQKNIEFHLKDISAHCDLILVTGGLGPTKDDVTKKAICSFFNCDMRRDPQVLEHVQKYFERLNRPMLEVNRMQADVPTISEVLFNELGTAPGMWIDYQSKIYAFFPGVPFEMKSIMEESFLDRLRKSSFSTHQIIHKHFLIAGIGESFLADKIFDLENALPPTISLSYLPSSGSINMRLNLRVEDESTKQLHLEIMDQFVSEVKIRLGVHFIAESKTSLVEALLQKLIQQKKKILTAESCTGGLVSHLLTSIPGSSEAFEGAVVVYSNTLKKELLGVKESTLSQFGAVSEETAKEMAEGALLRYDVDISVAITGIAGPGGAVANKPVGTVWVAVANRQVTLAKLFNFGQNRAVNIERAAQAALFEVWSLLK